MLLRARRLLLAVALAGAAIASGSARPAVGLQANEPSLSTHLWNIQLIGAPTAWQRGITGKGITIAIVDSGVDASHEDLAPNMVPGSDFTAPGTPPDDDNGHGTHVAGTAAAVAGNGRGVAGVAPEAKIMPVKVLNSSGAGVSNVDDAIKWAVDNGAQVVNLSLGDITDPLLPGDEGSYLEGIRYAWSKGAICVVASGNTYGLDSSYGDVPAILVAATTRDDEVANYSNRVSRARWAMAAPGGSGGEPNGILSTYWFSNEENAYAYNSGTSMAAPHVSGALALLRSAGLSPQQAVERLLATAKDLGPPGRDDDFGSGRLDVAKATEGLGTPAAAAPTTAAPAPSPSTTARPGSGAPAPSPTSRTVPATPGVLPAPAAGDATPASTDTTAPPAEIVSLPATTPTPLAEASDSPEELAVAPDSTTSDDVPTSLATVAALAVSAVTAAAMWFVRLRARREAAAQ